MSSYNITIPITPFTMPQGRWEWVDGHGWLWMTSFVILSIILSHCSCISWVGNDTTMPSFSERFSFLIDKNIQKKWKFIQAILTTPKGEDEGPPWLYSEVKVQRKEEKHGVEPCRSTPLSNSPHHWVLRIILGPYASLSGPTCRWCVLCIVIGPYASSLCATYHRGILCTVARCCCALPIFIGSCVLSLGPMFRHWILCFVVGSYMLLSGPMCCRRVLHIIVGGPKHCLVRESMGNRLYCPRILLAMVDFNLPLLGSTHRWVWLALIGPVHLVLRYHSVPHILAQIIFSPWIPIVAGFKVSSWEEEEKRGQDKGRGPFSWHTRLASHCMGPPFCSSLPDSSIQQDGCILASEGAVMLVILAFEGTEAVLMQPTSLNRGEGLVTGMMGKVGSVEGEGKGEVVTTIPFVSSLF